jgi:hypothetical protein
MTVHQGAVRLQGIGGLFSIAPVTWPVNIPQCPILNGLSEQKQTNILTFAPDVGPAKMVRRSTKSFWKTALTFRMTTIQYALFNNFYVNTLEDGTLPFVWPHPITKILYFWMFDSGAAPRVDRMTPKTVRVGFNLIRYY